jgi:hypothetical protein
MNLRAGLPRSHHDDTASDTAGGNASVDTRVVILVVLLRDVRDLEETEEFGRDPG